ncbi:hypothetical protein FB561_2542 [Kribbella amoyensis]|uniref:DNA topoisomerase (ATP-hydrolyzing) n=1 Tax=Kribbella amoyensis TaxID=996641 RepID=A0A561BRE4_9ACTN|nr:hypothetical protein [Kribbella amoyensis]TWD81426.1 hypothetical protein FB561_2542 [Kribbella amoyensis]
MYTTTAHPLTQPLARPPLRRRRDRNAVPALWRQVVRSGAKEDDRTVQREPDRSAFSQLEIYDAVLRAFERRAEVLDTIAAASDRDAAVGRVRDLLAVSPAQAGAVVDLPLHRFTTGTRDRVARRADELRQALTR